MDGAPSLKSESNSIRGTKVLLDTNFLLLPFQRRIDIFEEIPRLLGRNVIFIILPQVQKELEWLHENGTAKEKRAVSNSFRFIDQYCQRLTAVPPTIQNLNADSALLEYAKTESALVATNDADLRRKLAKQGSRAIFLRKLAILALTEDE